MSRRSSGTSQQLRTLRSLNIQVFHPDDADGRELLAQLQRIGCRVNVHWPPTDRLDETPDLIFLAVRPEVIDTEWAWLKRPLHPPIIAVLTYENPTIIDAMLKMKVTGVIASPVKSSGLLSSIVLARHLYTTDLEQARYTAKLEQRLLSQRKVDRAKNILMQTRHLTEEEAYALIREQAMAKRVTTESIADAVINASEILSYVGKKKIST